MKIKTVKSASKRIIKTGRGKFRRRNLSAQHLTAGKSKRTLRAQNKSQQISAADISKLKKLVPYK